MTDAPPAAAHDHRHQLSHRVRRMVGRDTQESHRAATPLELLFDLTFVVSFGIAGDQMSHLIAEGHIAPGIGGFGFALFAICWAWINFSWFASAFDTDDWFFRLTTMVQMIGVIVLAVGLPDMFHSLDEGHGFDNRVMVIGYVIMRIAMVVQWLRVAQQDPEHRSTALAYAGAISMAQLGWVVVALVQLPVGAVVAIAPLLYVVELGGPLFAEKRYGTTPWHADHIAERYGLLTIIALGEGMFGTIASVSAIVEEQGWTTEAVLVIVAGVGLTFALWWSYFVLPAGKVLHRHRDRAWIWGYTHLFLFGSIAATGAGMHVAAYVVEGVAEIGTVGAVLATAIPVLVFSLALFGIYAYLLHAGDPFHLRLMAAVVAVLVAAVVLAAMGTPFGVCLLIVTAAPVVIVVGYETLGHRHQQVALTRALA